VHVDDVDSDRPNDCTVDMCCAHYGLIKDYHYDYPVVKTNFKM